MLVEAFNLLSILTALGVVLNLVYVRRLNTYIPSRSWTLKQIAWSCFLLAQIGGLLNVYFYNSGLNWLGVVNSVGRFAGVILLVISYSMLEGTLKGLLKRIQGAVVAAQKRSP
jgi:hypothetical protein